MKKKNLIRTISMGLVLSLFLTMVASGAANIVRAEEKISPALLEFMQDSKATDRIPVSMWLVDINQEEVEKLTEQEIGFTADDIEVISEDLPEDLALNVMSLSEDVDVIINEEIEQEILQDFDEYMERTADERELERELTDEYNLTRREICVEKYTVANDKFISSMRISDENVIFRSQLAPMIIADLTVREIYKVAESSLVLNIGKYESEEPEVDSVSNCEDKMKQGRMQLGVSGNGVRVGLLDAGIVDTSNDEFKPHSKTENIVRFFKHGDGVSVNPDNGHAEHVGKILAGNESGVAYGATVYSACWGNNGGLDRQIESLIAERGVSVINISGGGAGGSNASNSVSFYDHIINTHNVVIVNSGGNGRTPSNRYHSSRAISDNVITVTSAGVGANNGKLLNFVHEQGPGNVSKPDMAAYGGDTSSSAPFVSGTVALMMELRPSLKSQPHAVKAILMASVHEKATPPDHCILGGTIMLPLTGFNFKNANTSTGNLEFNVRDLFSTFAVNGCTPIETNKIYGINVSSDSQMQISVNNGPFHTTNRLVQSNPFVSGANNEFKVVIRPLNPSVSSEISKIDLLSSTGELLADTRFGGGKWDSLASMRDACVCRPQEHMHEGISSYTRQGAGIMNPYIALAITARGNFRTSSISQGTSQIKFHLPKNAATRLNVSLSWLRGTTTGGNHVSTSPENLSLTLQSGTNVNAKRTSNLPVSSTQMVYYGTEIAEFNSWEGNPNFTSTIEKHSSGNTPVRFALAWSVDNGNTGEDTTIELIYDSRNDNNLVYYTGDNSSSQSFHWLLGSNSGKRRVLTDNVIEISERGGTSQGIDIKLANLPIREGFAYNFYFSGSVGYGSTTPDMFINAIWGTSAGGTITRNLRYSTTYSYSGLPLFDLGCTMTYDDIVDYLAAGVGRLRLGGASGRSLLVTRVTVAEIPIRARGIIYDMNMDGNLHLFEGHGSSQASPHKILGSNSGKRTLFRNPDDDYITITERGGTSQGIDIRLANLNTRENHEYRFEFQGNITGNQTTDNNVWLRTVDGSSIVTLQSHSVTNPNLGFVLVYTATHEQIKALILANPTQRFRLGGVNQRDFYVYDIRITEICKSNCC